MTLVFGLMALFFGCSTLLAVTGSHSTTLWRVMSITSGLIALFFIACLIVTILVDFSYTGALLFVFLASLCAAAALFAWGFVRPRTGPTWTP